MLRALVKWMPVALVSLGLLTSCSTTELGNSGLASAIKVAAYKRGQDGLSDEGITQTDLRDLSSGNLLGVKARYEAIPPNQISLPQLRLLCDLYIGLSHISRSQQCLDHLDNRLISSNKISAKAKEAIAGRRALVSLAAGQNASAIAQSKNLETLGGQYIYALASARFGNHSAATNTAKQLSKALSFPRRVYFAANIWLTLNRCDKVLDLLINPRTRLAKDYGLSAYTAALGNKVEPATFRIDLFEDFRFGHFDAFSYAPRANQYVEFMTGYCLVQEGKSEEGKVRLQHVLNDPDTPAYRELHWMTLQALAKIAVKEQNAELAEKYYLTALQVIEEIRVSITTDTGRIGFISDKFSVYANLVELYQSQRREPEALATLERAKGRALVDLLAEREVIAPAQGDASAASALLEDFTTLEARLAIGRTQISKSALGENRKQLNQTRRQMARAAPKLSLLVNVEPRPLSELLKKVTHNELILHFHRIGNKLYASLIEDGKVTMHTLDYEQVLNNVQALRESIAGSQALQFAGSRRKSGNTPGQDQDAKPANSKNDYLTPAKRLYDQLIRPYQHKIVAGKELIVIPTASLFYLPFGALHDGTQYLTQRVALRVMPSLTTYGLINSSPPPNENLLIVANPDLNDSDLDLSGTEMEANRLAWLWPEVSLLMRDEATEARVTQAAPNYGYLHIASHGEFNSERPLNSRLRLRASGDFDGSLTAAELYDWRLNSRLVVLSACETAVSEISPGDDAIGLMTGFLYAGAHGVIGSLWAVNDVLTSELITMFYSELQKNQRPSVALQRAQIQMMQQYPHPYLWAALSYIGLE